MTKAIKKKIDSINSVTLKPLFRRMIGWKEIEDKIDTIHYFLNSYIDITHLPKATDLLRKVQIADTELLRIVTGIFTKEKLTYWLDYGTLLGAVRHQGFVPWDDDLDLAMPRTDFEKAVQLLPKYLDSYDVGCKIGYGQSDPGRFWVNIWTAGLVLDIEAVENISADKYEGAERLQSLLFDCRRYYTKHRNKTFDHYQQRRNSLFGTYETENPIWFHNPECEVDRSVYKNSDIFPLVKMKFEDYDFYCPNNVSSYLSGWYGNYMVLPKSGLLHHKGSGDGVYNNSIKHGVDMDKLILALKKIKV